MMGNEGGKGERWVLVGFGKGVSWGGCCSFFLENEWVWYGH